MGFVNTLQSHQYLNVIDLISEGPIQGFVTPTGQTGQSPLQSVYLNGVIVQNSDGTYNFGTTIPIPGGTGYTTLPGTGVTMNTVLGTGDQAPVLPSAPQGNEVSVGTKVLHSVPTLAVVTVPNLTRVRVTLKTPSLVFTNLDGSMNGTRVDFTIGLSINGGAYTVVVTDSMSGLSTGPYCQQYLIPLPATYATFTLQITRITADNISNPMLQNDLYLNSYTEIIDVPLRYPYSALVGIGVDSEYFSSLPTRGYLIQGMIVDVPDNYNTITRAYTGTWSGNFVKGYTNNPAWVFRDMLVNDRYGLGQYVGSSQVDKWGLYAIAQYCDAGILYDTNGNYVSGGVPSGFLNPTTNAPLYEPRFTCNAYLQTATEAYTLLQNLATVFRGVAYWAGGQVVATQDSPSNPVAIFTPANVIDGSFQYVGTSAKARHTVVLVTWNDPANQYKQTVEYVEDTAGIALYGIVTSQITAVGCTSRGQAHRTGLWLLYTERLESEVCTFTTGIEYAMLKPGVIIQTSDPTRAGIRMGGRLHGATSSSLFPDGTFNLLAGKTYTVSVMCPDGTISTLPVSNAVPSTVGPTTAINCTGNFSSVPQDTAMFVLVQNDLVPEEWRIVSIVENGTGQAQISAVNYNYSKYGYIEQNLALQTLPTRGSLYPIPTTPTFNSPPVVETTYTNGIGTVGNQMVIGWAAYNTTLTTTPSSGMSVSFIVTVQDLTANGLVQSFTTTSNTLLYKDQVIGDTYLITVQGRNPLGQTSPIASCTFTSGGQTTLPQNYDVFSVGTLSDGTRVLTFNYSAHTPPPDLAGAYIRYTTGSTGTWATMTPWNNAPTLTEPVESRAFPAGVVTFAIKAATLGGLVCSDANTVYCTATLPSFSSGSALEILRLQATSYVFAVQDSGGSLPATITLTAYVENLGATTPTFSVTAGTATLTTVAGAQTCNLAYANMTSDSIEVTVSQAGLTDTISIAKVYSGASITAFLTNDACTVSADALGNVLSIAGASGQFEIYAGSSLLTTGVTYALTSGGNPQGLTYTLDTLGNYVVTGVGSWATSSYSASLSLTATVTATGATYTRVFSISKAIAGATGSTGPTGPAGSTGSTGPAAPQYATVNLYQWATVQPGSPSGTTTYTWSGGINSSYTGGNSWGLTIGSNPGVPGIQLWVVTQQITAPGGTATTTVNWSSSNSVYAASGNGLAGYQSAIAQVFQWAVTLPTGPVGTGTWAWASSSFGAAPSGWSTTSGAAPSAGYTLWAARVTVTDTAVNATTSFSWSTASINATAYAGTNGTNGSNGTNGTNGANGATGTTGAQAVIAYAVVASSSTPSSTAFVTVGGNTVPSYSSWGMGESWSTSVPAYSAGQTIYQTNGIYSPSTGQTVWNQPYISALKVGSLSAISANLGSVTAGSISDGNIPAFGAWGSVPGMWLSPAGLMLGRYSASGGSGYLEIWKDGTFHSPGLIMDSAGNATFQGSLNAVNGTFTGTLTSTNQVTTGSIINQAVTVPFSASGIPAPGGLSQSGWGTINVPAGGTSTISVICSCNLSGSPSIPTTVTLSVHVVFSNGSTAILDTVSAVTNSNITLTAVGTYTVTASGSYAVAGAFTGGGFSCTGMSVIGIGAQR